MNDIFKALLVALLSFIVSMITYHIQFKRNRRIDYRSKVKLLFVLIKETISDSEMQILAIQDMIATINQDHTFMPLLASGAYPASKYLQDKVTSDDFYYAFVNLLSNCFGSEEIFFDLKYNGVFIEGQFSQIYTMHKEAKERDHARRIRYRELYNEIDNKLMEILAVQQQYPNIHQTLVNLNNIRTTFLNVMMNTPQDGRGNIIIIQIHYVVPMYNLFPMVNSPILVPLVSTIGEMYRLFQDIDTQNPTIANEIQGIIPNLNLSIEVLRNVKSKMEKWPLVNYY